MKNSSISICYELQENLVLDILKKLSLDVGNFYLRWGYI